MTYFWSTIPHAEPAPQREGLDPINAHRIELLEGARTEVARGRCAAMDRLLELKMGAAPNFEELAR